MLERTVVIGIGIGWFSETVYLQIRFLISLRRAMDMKTHIEGVVFVTLLLLPKVCVARRMLSITAHQTVFIPFLVNVNQDDREIG